MYTVCTLVCDQLVKLLIFLKSTNFNCIHQAQSLFRDHKSFEDMISNNQSHANEINKKIGVATLNYLMWSRQQHM